MEKLFLEMLESAKTNLTLLQEFKLIAVKFQFYQLAVELRGLETSSTFELAIDEQEIDKIEIEKYEPK